MKKYNIVSGLLLTAIVILVSFSVIFIGARQVEAANPYIQNVLFGQDEQGDYISFDWVGIPSPDDQIGEYFRPYSQDMILVWLNRFNPSGTIEGIMLPTGLTIGDFSAKTPNGSQSSQGSYSGFGGSEFASGNPYGYSINSQPDLNKSLPQHFKTYINPTFSPWRTSFSEKDFITLQIAQLIYPSSVNDERYTKLLSSDDSQYFYQPSANPLLAIPYTNVKFGFDENNLLKVSFDWVGSNRSIALVAGLNGNASYDSWGYQFIPDPTKDASIVFTDGYNANPVVSWFTVGLNVQKGQHYEIPVNGLVQLSPTNTLLLCNWYHPCPVNRSQVESLLGRSFKPDDYITVAFASQSPSVPYELPYYFNDQDKYYFSVIPPTINQLPIITLNGDNAMALSFGDIFIDPGATATDDIDGDLTSNIIVTGTVDTTVIGTTTLTYSVTDSGGLTDVKIRTVTVNPPPPEPPQNDNIPPVSIITLSGASIVTIEITAKDNDGGSGVLAIKYNLDNTGFKKVVGNMTNFSVSTEGKHTVQFFSTDKNGNNEQIQAIEFVIDKIAPEVTIEFDPAIKDLIFTGKDNISMQSEITVQDQDDTITLLDKTGNTTEIKLKDKDRKNKMKAEIKSIKYNGVEADISKNEMSFSWNHNNKKNLEMLSQHAKSKKDYNITAVYDGVNTKITGKDQLGKINKIETGFKILQITTDKGDLNWSY